MSDAMEAPQEPTLRPLYTRNFVALLATQAAFGYSSSAFQMLPKFLDRELGAEAAEIGAVVAAFGLASVVATPFMGDFVDRFGRRRSLACGALLLAVTSWVFAAVDSLGPFLFVLRAIQGIAFGLTFVAGSTLAVDEAPPERLAQALGIFGLTMLGMNAVGPLVTEEIATRSGWPVAFAAAGFGGLLCALLSRAVRETPHDADAPAPDGLLAMLRRPRQARMATVIVMVASACGVMFAFHQPFALALGIERVGLFFAAYASAAAVVRLGLGGFIDRLGRHRVAIGCLALYAGVVAAMTRLDAIGLVPLGAVFGVAHGLFFPACNALALEDVPVRARGKAMAIFIGAFNLGFSLGPLALGRVADAAGYPPVFAIAAAIAFLALVLLSLSPEGRARRVHAAEEVPRAALD